MPHGSNYLVKHLSQVTMESRLHKSAVGVLMRVVFNRVWELQGRKLLAVLGKSLSINKVMQHARISLSWLPLERMAHHCLLPSFSRARHTNLNGIRITRPMHRK